MIRMGGSGRTNSTPVLRLPSTGVTMVPPDFDVVPDVVDAMDDCLRERSFEDLDWKFGNFEIRRSPGVLVYEI